MDDGDGKCYTTNAEAMKPGMAGALNEADKFKDRRSTSAMRTRTVGGQVEV